MEAQAATKMTYLKMCGWTSWVLHLLACASASEYQKCLRISVPHDRSCVVADMSVTAALLKGSEPARGLWLPSSSDSVPRVAARDLTRLTFLRDFVAKSRPVVITGAIESWPAARWSPSSLSERHGGTVVTVNMTPNGWGDALLSAADATAIAFPDWTPAATDTSAVGDAIFVKPEERRMTLAAFFDALAARDAEPSSGISGCGIPYLSYQNDSLRRETPSLFADVLSGDALMRDWPWCPWAWSECEAVNLWAGDGRSTSAPHKDHYENLYTTVTGEKVFSLFPPSDVVWLQERRYPTGRYRFVTAESGGEGRWEVTQDGEDTTPWVGALVDPLTGTLLDAVTRAPPRPHSCLRHASPPLTVRLQPGECLYLPALWYHQVAQVGTTIAVNYWFEMQWDSPMFAHYSMLQAVAPLVTAESDRACAVAC